MSSKDTDPLANRTNTVPNGRRPAKPSGKATSSEDVSGARDTNDELQKTIPGTKPARKKAPKKVATQGQVDELNARIAELEAAAAAQNTMPPPVTPVPPPATPAPPRRAATASRPAVATPAAPSTRQERPPVTTPNPSANNDGDEGTPRPKPLKMIPEPPKGSNTQIGMRLANSIEGNSLYNAIRAAVRDCVRLADLELTLEWKEQPLEKKLLVINAAKEKAAYLRRMEKDWATHRLATQFLKNRRSDAYKAGILQRPARYDYLVDNSAMRSKSGSRVKKAKLHLEARLKKRALEQEQEEEEEEARRRRKKARQTRPRTDDSQPEFVQGSSRDFDQEPPVGNEDDAHPTIDHDWVPGRRSNFDCSDDEVDDDPEANLEED